MQTTVSTNKDESIKVLLQSPQVRDRFQEMLGKRASGFLTSVLNVVNSNNLLQEANQSSILFAAATAASLDLPVNPNLGFAYIIPYNQKINGKYEKVAQFQLGYKGFIQLAQRTNMFKTINAVDVREGEIFTTNRLTGEIIFSWIDDIEERNSKKIIGYVGYFELLNGFQKMLYMTKKEAEGHARKYSKTFQKSFGLWVDEFDTMALKTVIKLLLSRYAPLSIEMQRAVEVDQGIITDWDGNVEYVDNGKERISVEEYSAEEEKKRIKTWIAASKTPLKLSEVNTAVHELDDKEITSLYEDKLKSFEKKTA